MGNESEDGRRTVGREQITRRVGACLQRYFPGVRFLGAAFWAAWILLIYSTEFFHAAPDVHFYNALCYFVATLSIAATYIALGSRYERGFRLVGSRKVTLGMGAAASVGTLLVVAGAGAPQVWGLALCIAGNVLTGCGTGFVSLRCACLFGELSARRAFLTTCTMMAVAMLIYSATLTYPGVMSLVVTAALPTLAALAALLDNTGDATARSEGSGALGARFWRFVATVFVLSLVFTVSRGFYPNALQLGQFNDSRGLVSLVVVVICLVAIVATVSLPEGFRFGRLVYGIIVVMALIIAVIPISGIGSTHVGEALSTAFILLGTVAWALFGTVTSITGLPPLRVFGFGFSAYLVGSMVGWPFGQLANSLWSAEEAGYATAVLSLAALAAFFVLFRKGDVVALLHAEGEATGVFGVGGAGCSALEGTDGEAVLAEMGRAAGRDAARSATGTAADSRKARWRLAVEEMARTGGLTARETEAFFLMAKGHNARILTGDLDISYNTARTHVRNIYTKLGVHSQAELLERIDECIFDLRV